MPQPEARGFPTAMGRGGWLLWGACAARELGRGWRWWLGLAQPGFWGRAAGGGWGLRTAAAPHPQPAPLGSGGGEHLSSCVILFSVALVLKAIKSFFYLLLIFVIVLVNTVFLRQITGTPVLCLPSLRLQCGSAWHSVGTAHGTQSPSCCCRGGRLHELLTQSLAEEPMRVLLQPE